MSRKHWLALPAVGLFLSPPATRAIALASAATAPQAQPATHPDAEVSEAATGIGLTRSGHFAEAIPHLQQALAHAGAAQAFAVRYDLALCYFGAMQYPQAITTLEALRHANQGGAAVNNLLTQAYVATGQRAQARASFARAQQQAPADEKLYAFVADACNDHGEYELGLLFMDAGLKALPSSARLHYERGLFLAQLDRLEEALPEFTRAAALEPASDIAFLARVQAELYQTRLDQALKLVRQAIADGHRDYRMLSLLGTVLMQGGAAPGEADFAEAAQALEASVAAEPAYSASQLALGKLYLMEGKAAEAKDHLETARRLEPGNPSVYASLATAYGRLGQLDARQESLATLSRLVERKSTAGAAHP